MSVPVIYLAHPVGAPTVAGVNANLAAARDWLRYLIAKCPDIAWCVAWLPYLDVLDDNGANRERGLRDDCEIVRRCDAVLLVGPRVSDGMAREAMHARTVLNCVDMPMGRVADAVNAWSVRA